MAAESKLGYLAYYLESKIEIYAKSLYEAKVKALAAFKPPPSKSHWVHVYLAEKDGSPVIHVADF